MIVCSCSNVSERDIKKLLPATVDDIMFDTGCAMTCGICFEHLKKLVEEHAAVQSPLSTAPSTC